MSEEKNRGPKFYGSASVGARGQIVIPSELREDAEIESGDKLLFLGRSGKKKGFMVKKPERLLEIEEEIRKLREKVEDSEE